MVGISRKIADSYSLVKKGKLKLKKGKVKKPKKVKKITDKVSQEELESNENTLKHGGWWQIKDFLDINGPVAIEMRSMTYVKALDDGLFCLGKQHNIGEGPDAEEIFTAMRISDTLIALKSGYNKYLGVQTDGKVVGRSDAVSGREQWQPTFEDGKLALLGHNGCFLAIPDEEDRVFCTSKTASENEYIQIRSYSQVDKPETETDSGRAKDVELSYVKKFQSFEDKRIRVNPEDTSAVKRARLNGKLHETLLDRREKMKSDKFCK